MKYTLAFLFTVFFNTIILSQVYSINGKIIDSKTNQNLNYANIRIENSTKGTTSNLEGIYSLKLEEGKYKLIASYIGYQSDTITIKLEENAIFNFSLTPIELELNEVTVKPQRNPAYDIIEKCIEQKNRIKQKLNSYKYSSYTKGIIKTTQDLGSGGFTMPSKNDTLKIVGILENESRGFFKKPNNKKHYIVARKQTANTPPFINVLTGGNLLQSFYEEQLLFMGKNIPSPISDEALTYYYFYIEKEIAIDNQKIYQIYFNTDNTADPGFYGRLFIADESFNLMKVDVQLNQMANFGGLFEEVKIFQQFSVFKNNITLPIDYRLNANGNYLGIAKFGFSLNTIMNSYKINVDIKDDFFDSAIISVLPNADKKDEIYWKAIQSIPATKEERIAYARIDSITNITKTFGQDFSFLSNKIKLNKNFSVTGPLTFYNFNKVQGNTLNLALFYKDGEEQRLNSSGSVSYGFADDLVKEEFNFNYKLGNLRTSEISFSYFDKVTDLFSRTNNYNKFTSTFLSLFTKYDFRNYFYRKGFDININGEVTPTLSVGLGFISNKDKSAKNNSDFSFFNREKKFSKNIQISELFTQAIKTSFKIDFRNFIEDGFFRRRITPRNHILFEGTAFLSNNKLLNTDVDFQIYELMTYGSFSTIGNWSLDFQINKILSNGTVPIQYLYALPGNINAGSKNNSFRTLKIGEVYGDDVTTIFLRHNFQDDLFKLFQIPILKDLQLQLSTYLNIALSDITGKNNRFTVKKFKKFTKPFYEFGFSIGHILIPINFEFTWKLNYRGKNNFAFGINSIAL